MPTREESIRKYRKLMNNPKLSPESREYAKARHDRLIAMEPLTRPKLPIERTPDIIAILQRTRQRRKKRGVSIGG